LHWKIFSEVTLNCVTRHHGILGNEEVKNRARQASATAPLVAAPALGIPKCLAKEESKNWTEYQHFIT
jgi:hypothetical protein